MTDAMSSAAAPVPGSEEPDPAAPSGPVVASALPTEPRPYFHFLRTPRARWWKGALVILSLLVGYLLVALVLVAIATGIDIASGRTTLESLAAGVPVVTPAIFIANNLSLAALIPLSLLLQWAFFGQRPRWLSSVVGGFRWRWFGRAAAVIVPIYLVYISVTYLIDPSLLGGASADGLVLLIGVLLTTPLQAAGEEYGARGLITRAAASWSDDPRVGFAVGTLIASLLFMFAHGAGDPWLNAYYFSFGVAMSVAAWRTGGLEVPVIIHVSNNLFALLPIALFGDVGAVFERSAGAGGPIVLLPIVVMIVAVLIMEWWSRRARVARLGPPEAVAA